MEKKLKDKNCDVKELLMLTKQAQDMKQETQKRLEMAQNGEELSTMSNIVPVEKNLTLSSDLQHDLNQTKNEADYSNRMREDEQKRVKQLTLRLEEATGLDNFKAVVEKAERYQETKDTLNELRRNSQQKLLQLYQKRDQLSEKQKHLNLAETDPKKLQEMYDEKEKLVIKIETEIEDLNEQMEKRRRLEAEIEFCISNLGTRLGIKNSESDSKS